MPSFNDPSEPYVAVISGPPGAGKTTVARRLAEQVKPSVHMEADEFWHFIATGFVEPWEPESRTQNEVVVRAVARAADAFAAGGYLVVLDWVLGPWALDLFLENVPTPGLRVDYVVLRPRVEVALHRMINRPERPLREEPVRKMHREFTTRMGEYEACVVDTSDSGIDETVELVRERLRSGEHAVASPA